MFRKKIKSLIRTKKLKNITQEGLIREIEKYYNQGFDKPLDLKKPVTINEKLQYLKVTQYYNDPIVTICVDKYKVKKYLSDKGLSHLAAKLYGVYDDPSEIEWDKLPQQFVIKCNHGCGYNILCSDKSCLDKKKVTKRLNRWMKQDYWTVFIEPQYRYVPKKILVEEYLGADIHTYKFYCFNGIPKVCYVSSNGEDGEYDKYYDFFDMEWNRLNIALKDHEHYPGDIMEPEGFKEMKQVAGELCKEFPFVRIDLYNVNGKVYLSEYTFIPTGGYMKLSPQGTDVEWGKWLHVV